ncbi:MAG: hypothetical protein J0L86_04950 [Flavobacteriales bacterium]|nr:hypothetical protein [Flavobacteriales bacterium]
MLKKTKLWIDMAKLYSREKHSKLFCPECKVGVIKIVDVYFDNNKKIDRYFTCDNCGKYNVLTMDNNVMDSDSSDMQKGQ